MLNGFGAGVSDGAGSMAVATAAATIVASNRSGGFFMGLQAVLSVRRDRPPEAIAVVRESLAQIERLHDKFALVYALVSLAAAAEQMGDDAWAARIRGRTERVCRIAAQGDRRPIRELARDT
jgi:hypothetical protein